MNQNNTKIPLLYWGFWATAAFGIVYMLFIFYYSFFFTFIMAGIDDQIKMAVLKNSIMQNGSFLAWSTTMSTILALYLSVLFIKCRQGSVLKEYLALKGFSLKTAVIFFVVISLWALTIETADSYYTLSSSRHWIAQITSSTSNLGFLCINIILIAPLGEELICRGVLYQGFKQTRFGPVGAIVMTSLLWSAIHIQYNAFDILMIFLLGLLLGWARYKSKSLYLPFFMHAFWNALSLTLFFAKT